LALLRWSCGILQRQPQLRESYCIFTLNPCHAVSPQPTAMPTTVAMTQTSIAPPNVRLAPACVFAGAETQASTRNVASRGKPRAHNNEKAAMGARVEARPVANQVKPATGKAKVHCDRLGCSRQLDLLTLAYTPKQASQRLNLRSLSLAPVAPLYSYHVYYNRLSLLPKSRPPPRPPCTSRRRSGHPHLSPSGRRCPPRLRVTGRGMV